MGSDVVEHVNVDGNLNEMVSEDVDGFENESANVRMEDIESESAEWCGMKGAEVPMVVQTQRKRKKQI